MNFTRSIEQENIESNVRDGVRSGFWLVAIGFVATVCGAVALATSAHDVVRDIAVTLATHEDHIDPWDLPKLITFVAGVSTFGVGVAGVAGYPLLESRLKAAEDDYIYIRRYD